MNTNENKTKVGSKNADSTKVGSSPSPAPSNTPSASDGYGRPLASSPLVVTLLIVLLAAVCIQGVMLAGIYVKGKSEEEANGLNKPEAPALVAKKDKDEDGSTPTSPPVRLVPSPLQSSPLGSLLTDDFFSDDWQPFAEMARMREQMDKLFDDSFGRFRTMPGFDEDWLNLGTAFSGNAAIDEKDGNYTVTLEIPGADEATLDIKLEDGVLSIGGKREELNEEKDNDGRVIRRSQSSSTFQRSFALPADAESTGMTSDYKDGVLTITIPKTK